METETRGPGASEVETMADAVEVLNKHGYRKTRSWRVHHVHYADDVVMNEHEFTCFNEFEAVAIARRIVREKEGT